VRWLDQLDLELRKARIPASRRRRIIAEFADHLASEPGSEDRLGPPVALARQFADQFGTACWSMKGYGARWSSGWGCLPAPQRMRRAVVGLAAGLAAAAWAGLDFHGFINEPAGWALLISLPLAMPLFVAQFIYARRQLRGAPEG
jgi:hypothetical protein